MVPDQRTVDIDALLVDVSLRVIFSVPSAPNLPMQVLLTSLPLRVRGTVSREAPAPSNAVLHEGFFVRDALTVTAKSAGRRAGHTQGEHVRVCCSLGMVHWNVIFQADCSDVV